ncbi:MAG: NADH-quinone oxidoreductase subunit NuoN [Alphaproteobacteria bacterium]
MESANLPLIFPELFIVFTALGYLISGVFQGNKSTAVLCWSAIASFSIATIILFHASWDTSPVLGNTLIIDRFSSAMRLILLLGLIVSCALSTQYLHQERIARFEYPVLVMIAGVGMLFMVSANDFLALYMGLELQSLCLYILAAFHRNSTRSGEAAAKYFLLGILSSGILLFGISLIYGFAGSLDFIVIAEFLKDMKAVPPGFTVGMVFILAALAFKISAAPFHMWTPDVYQGAPTSVSAFFALVPKVAALALLVRLLFGPFAPAQEQWVQVLYFITVLSLFFGSFGGIAQKSIKRLMAYSSINHIGYMLIGLVVGTQASISAVVLYLLIYLVMTAGVFAVILCLRKDGIAIYNIRGLAGLSHSRPLLAYTMAVFMFAMSGVPPLAGFFGKMFIFNAAIAEGYYFLAVFGVLASVVSAYYYLRIVKVMFFDAPVDEPDDKIGFELHAVLFGALVFIVGFVFMPTHLIDFADAAASSLF